jgi:predicted ATPase/DNA-binding SARP family transcriptional activator
MLLLRAGEAVSTDELVEALWPQAPPANALTALQGYVLQLRRLLEPETSDGRYQILVTKPTGYALAIEPEQLDLRRFERLLVKGRTLLAAGSATDSADVLREALGLWRGPPLSDFRYDTFTQAAVIQLEELRLACLEERIGADLALGRHTELVGELESLVDEHPLRERPRGQLMLALYRARRQAEALEVYQSFRRLVAEGLGIEPSAELRKLQTAILRQDSFLAVEPAEIAARRHIPAPATPIIGRNSEQAELSALLITEGARLVTITGPGGVGKTRLAIEVASELAESFTGGVFFVALAPLQDAALVPSAIAGALGVRESGDQPLLETLKGHLRNQRALLVLDNFEHVLDAAHVAAELLAGAPALAILATSRGPLHLYGEHEHALEPLALPDPNRTPAPAELASVDSVALFHARARAVNRRFELTAANANAVAEICERLDGLPLALELAAARAKLLPPDEVLARLEESLPVLTGGPRDAPARQRTLRATIGWSYALLEDNERTLFRRLAVFAGGCTIEAAEAVCDAELDTLAALVEASVLRSIDVPGGERRFSMLRVVREYAAEKLEGSGEADDVRARHMEYLLDFGRDANARMTGAEQAAQLQRVAHEHDNIRATLAWALEQDPEQALRLVAQLQRFFYLRGYSAEGVRALESALAQAPEAEPALRARALRSAGTLAEGIGDFTRARSYLEDGVEQFRRLGDPKELAATLNNLGAVAVRQGDVAGARGYFAESLEVKRVLGDRHGTAVSLSNLGMLEARAERFESARECQEEARSILRELGDENGLANCLTALAELALLEGALAEARALLAEAIPLTEHVGDRAATVEALSLLARLGLEGGDGARAREHAERAVALASGLNDAFTTVVALEVASDVLAASGELVPAVSLRATAARVRTESDAPESRVEEERAHKTLDQALAGLGTLEYERAWEVGGAADAREALASAASEPLR